MKNDGKVAMIGLATALVLGFAGCDKKTSSESNGNSDEQATGSTTGGAQNDPEAPSPEERVQTLKDDALKEAREEITEKNAEKVASDLEKEIESDLAEN